MKEHDYLLVVVGMFSNMCTLVPWKNNIKVQVVNMYFKIFWGAIWGTRDHNIK